VLTYASAAGLVALTVYLLIVGAPILLPFVIAIFVTYLISAVAAATARIKVGGRTVPRPLRYGVSMALVLLMGWLMLKLVIGNIGQVIAAAPLYEQNLVRVANQVAGWLGLEELTDLRGLMQGRNLATLVRSLALSLTSMLGSLGTVAIYTVFLLLERANLSKKIAALFPEPEREALVRRIIQRIGKEIQTYVWLKTLISLATSAASYLVMKAVALDLAEFWALLIFGLNFIPYIGAWLGVLFPASMALVQFHTPTPILAVVGGLTVTQFTGGSIIEPRIMGTGLNVSPVVMLLSLALWGTIWGVVGMFLAVPLMVVIMIVCSNFPATRPIAILLSADGELRA
jgi:predicted PurR-regulated permease PerM